MGVSITNFGRSGLHDWVVQRATAVILALYTVFLVGYFFTHPELQFLEWKQLFSHTGMKVFSLLALISLCAHAWVGLWTVSTDYIPMTGIRFMFQAVFILVLFVYMVWGIEILWGA